LAHLPYDGVALANHKLQIGDRCDLGLVRRKIQENFPSTIRQFCGRTNLRNAQLLTRKGVFETITRRITRNAI